MQLSHEELEEGAVFALDFDKLAKVAACGQALEIGRAHV